MDRISQLTAEQGMCIGRAMMLVAAAERGIVDPEREVIESFCARLAAPSGGAAALEPAWAPDEARRLLPAPELRELLIELCVTTAFADGFASVVERSLVNRIANDLEIPEERRSALIHRDGHLPHDEQVSLIRRALKHIAEKTSDRGASVHHVPVTEYYDEQRFALEKERIFRRMPVLLALSSELGAKGSFLTRDDYGLPLLLVRGPDGVARAFLNVCRHRGMQLLREPSGKARGFSCPYHAWTYDTRGDLVHMPHEQGFPGCARADLRLRELPTIERHGALWGVLNPSMPVPDIDAHLGGIGRELAGLRLDQLSVHDTHETVRRMNWKLCVDGFLEAYHLRTTHRDTFYPVVFDNIALHDHTGPHSRTVYPFRKIAELSSADPAGWFARPVVSFIYQLFPGTIIAVEPFHIAVIQIVPRAPDESLIRTTVLVSAANLQHQEALRKDVLMLRDGLEEDYAIGEDVQRSLRSGANESVVLGLFEHTLSHFHAAVEAATA
jgi:phenylpropionate dioxygenase-like ring-hydroxylating dioxygenase large terminal subunit